MRHERGLRRAVTRLLLFTVCKAVVARTMSDCCEDKACAIESLRARQSGTLKAVLGINAAMFVVVIVAGILAHSAALVSDSLDNLGDALTYGLSLYAVSRGIRAKATVAFFKGILILAAGVFALGPSRLQHS